MSDGGATDKDNVPTTSTTTTTRNSTCRREDDFHRAIARIAVSQVCEAEGFLGIQSTAVEVLADVAIRYVKEIGKRSSSLSCLSNRSECNFFDVVHALEDTSVLGTNVVREIRDFVSLEEEEEGEEEEEREESSFAYLLPRVPVVRPPQTWEPRFCETEGVGPWLFDHIPSWLPAFPIVGGGETSGGGGEKEVEEREGIVVEKGEPSMINGEVEKGKGEGKGKEGVEVAVVGGVGENGLEMKEMVEGEIGINPYLVPPVMYGEKEVSLIRMPRRTVDGFVFLNHVAGFDGLGMGFGNEGGGGGGQEMNHIGEKQKDVRVESPAKPPAVRLKLCGVKKPLRAAPVNVFGLEDGDDGKLANCNGRSDGEKEEKKRRAEPILMESVENAVDSFDPGVN